MGNVKHGKKWVALDEYLTENEITSQTADGFDSCILGVHTEKWGNGVTRVVYSTKKVIAKLVNQGLTHEEAVEHFEFNILGSYLGETTPIYLDDCFL